MASFDEYGEIDRLLAPSPELKLGETTSFQEVTNKQKKHARTS
jgi:hypothetical protein